MKGILLDGMILLAVLWIFAGGNHVFASNQTTPGASTGASALTDTQKTLQCECTANHSELPPSVSQDRDDIVLPPKLYAVVGQEFNIYFDNLVKDDIGDYCVDVASSAGIQQEERFIFTPTAAGIFPLAIELYNKKLGPD